MLEQIKEELADKWVFDINGMRWSNNNNNECGDNFESFKKGFDACINLEIPIKFAEWYSTEGLDNMLGLNGEEKNEEYKQFKNKGVTKELFNYWLNNVYGK